MIFGDKAQVAIEVEVYSEGPEGSVHFRLWVDGQSIGDWDDVAYSSGSLNWTREYLSFCGRRYFSEWDHLSGMSLLKAARFLPGYSQRLDISLIGMSATDNHSRIVLFESKDGKERFVWSENDKDVHEFVAPGGTFASAAEPYVAWLAEKVER